MSETRPAPFGTDTNGRARAFGARGWAESLTEGLSSYLFTDFETSFVHYHNVPTELVYNIWLQLTDTQKRIYDTERMEYLLTLADEWVGSTWMIRRAVPKRFDERIVFVHVSLPADVPPDVLAHAERVGVVVEFSGDTVRLCP